MAHVMEKKYLTISEIMNVFHVDEGFIISLEQEEIICPECRGDDPTKRFSGTEIEKLRIAKMLLEEMDVNLHGVEIILRMRESMIHMRRQFDDILDDLARQIKKTLEGR